MYNLLIEVTTNSASNMYTDSDLYRVQPRVGPDTGGSLGLSAPADLSSVDSRTCSSVKQSTLESSSGVSSPTHLIYNPQNYKPDQELNTKVTYILDTESCDLLWIKLPSIIHLIHFTIYDNIRFVELANA